MVSRRRALRLVVIAAVALVTLAVAGVLALPEIARRVVVWRLTATTNRPVTLSALELNLFKGRLALRGLRVMDRDQGPLATIERLEVLFSPRDLLRGHVRITDATLQGPAVRIVRTGPSAFNVSDLLVTRETRGGKPPAITIEKFALRGGAIAIEDRTLAPPRAWRVETLTLDARDVSTLPGAPPGVVTLGAVAAGSPISVWITGVRLAPPSFHATVIAREIDGSLAALYLPPGSPLSPARAKLDASATIDQDAVSGTRVTLDAVFGGVELRRPGQDSAFLTAPAVRVTVEDLRVRPGAVDLARLSVDGGSVVLEDTRLGPVRRWQADGIALEARNLSSARDAPGGVGTLRAVVAGSPVSVWVGNLRLAPLELHAIAIIRNVDFALFRFYVPPDAPVQPERGVVNASVRIDYDARRGTRLALDAGLSNVELRRAAHSMTAPAMRVTAEDVAFGDGAVTVGRVAIGSDRLTLEDRTRSPARTWPVQNLALEASRLSSRREDVQGIATARATVAGAAVSAFVTHVRLDPLELRATAVLRNLDLPLVQLYLPATVPVQLDRGLVNASLQIDHDVAGGTRLTADVTLTGAEARGRGAADGLTVSARSLRVALADARRHAETLDVGRLEITTSASLADSRAAAARIDLERLRIASEGLTWPIRNPARVELSARFRDGGEVDANGTAMLTAPPPMIAWATELAVQLKAVDVVPVAAYVPAASGLSGRVSANVKTSITYGASLTARVQGDVGGARLALTEGARTVLSLRRVDATGLDVLWPERVAVRQLRLDRPRALVERDRQGAFPLVTRFAPPRFAPPPAGPALASPPAAARETARRASPAIALDEVVVERGRLAFVDARDGAPARLDVSRIDITLRDAKWPAAAPARLRLDAALPAGGTVGVEGTVSAEPAAVDVKLVLTGADLAQLQPYLPFRAGVRGRVDANVAVAGPLSPALRLTVQGDATVRSAAISDGQRPVITVDQISARGIDATWPGRVNLERLRVRRSWALIERDRDGRFLLRTLLQRASNGQGQLAPGVERAPSAATASPTSPPPGAPAPTLEFRLGEAIFEEGAATIVDGITTPTARFEIAGARLAVQDFTWPARGPVKLQLASPMPGGGRLDVAGTLTLEPTRLEVRAALEGVELAPAQPYLPIEGRVAGRVTGELMVKLALDPIAVQVTGQTRLQAFRLADGDRPLVTAGRLEAVGIDVDWPRRIAVQRVQLRRPSLLIERDARGEMVLRRLVTPRWSEYMGGPDMAPHTPPSLGSAPAKPGRSSNSLPGSETAPAPNPARPTIEIGTFNLERGSGRFVDHTTTPPYAEEISRVDVTITGLTTAPDRRAQFTGDGAVGGGGTFKVQGGAAAGERPSADVKVDIRDYALSRANPYLERFTSWTATRGRLSASAGYTLLGTRLDAHHDVVVRRLEVELAGSSDEVRQRLGLPLGFLVSVLKDARGEIRLSVPVSGDLGTREFDFGEAVWSSVRALAIRLIALPFSRIGSLFFTEDSKVDAITLEPAVFETGTTRLAAATAGRLDRLAAFLRDAPAVNLRLAQIPIQADLDALKGERVRARLRGLPRSPDGGDGLEAARREYRERWPDRPVPATVEGIVAELATVEPVPDDTVRNLGARRLEVVRQELSTRGIDAKRLAGSPRRVSLVEAAGTPRVEFDLQP